MMKTFGLASLAAVAALAIFLSGCADDTAAPTEAVTTDQAEPAADNHADHSESEIEKAEANLAKLSPEDAAAAKEQHLCPVSGDMLGSMGAPQKVEVDGESVWICCAGCKDPLLQDPEKYLAKLEDK